MNYFVYPLSGIRKEAGFKGLDPISPRVLDFAARFFTKKPVSKEFLAALDNQILTRKFSKIRPHSAPTFSRKLRNFLEIEPGTLVSKSKSAELGIPDNYRKLLMRGINQPAVPFDYKTFPGVYGYPLTNSLDLVDPWFVK